MSIAIIERELPTGNEEGSLFDIFRTPYKFCPIKDKSIKRLPKSDKYIRGFVEDRHIPQEGSVFKMTHHQLQGRMKFGALKLRDCTNVLEEDGFYYFEIKEGRYVLEPVLSN